MTFEAYGKLIKSIGSLAVTPITSAIDQIQILKPETGPSETYPRPQDVAVKTTAAGVKNLFSRINFKLPTKEDFKVFFGNIGGACKKAWSEVKVDLKELEIEGHKNFQKSKAEVIEDVVRKGKDIRSIPFIFAKNTSGKYQLMYVRGEDPKKVQKIGIFITEEGYKVIDANGRNIMGTKVYPSVKSLADDFDNIVKKYTKPEPKREIIKGRTFEGVVFQDYEAPNHFTLLISDPRARHHKIEYYLEGDIFRLNSVDGRTDMFNHMDVIQGNEQISSRQIVYFSPYGTKEELLDDFLGKPLPMAKTIVEMIPKEKNGEDWAQPAKMETVPTPGLPLVPTTAVLRTQHEILKHPGAYNISTEQAVAKLKGQPNGLYVIVRGTKFPEKLYVLFTTIRSGEVRRAEIPIQADGKIKKSEDEAYKDIDEYLLDKLPVYKPYIEYE